MFIWDYVIYGVQLSYELDSDVKLFVDFTFDGVFKCFTENYFSTRYFIESLFVATGWSTFCEKKLVRGIEDEGTNTYADVITACFFGLICVLWIHVFWVRLVVYEDYDGLAVVFA